MKIKDYKPELFSIGEAIIKQKEYIKANNLPEFPPSDGHCWACSKNIYAAYFRKVVDNVFKFVSKEDCTIVTGITIEEAGNRLVTGCPHCNRSYCA